MIDTENLRTASLYINNQLLSRGLLKDGQNIDFADPCGPGGNGSATMSRIISLVNDLILRRDRDAEQRETLSTTMRSLRAENLKLVNDVTRLSEKHTEAQRKADIAATSENTLRTQLKSAESAVRRLKEEAARTKALVTQARSACANDVRRRDRQIDTLKKQLGEAGRARGSRTNPAITTINVTGDFGGEKESLSRSASTTAEDYTLRSETNAFLAKLAQDLGLENESILAAMRHTVDQLRQMSGYSDGTCTNDGSVERQLTWEDMSAELDAVLEHMKTILTNPSFVPIEEVEMREEEIDRLKDGWIKMENRWKDAVNLIDGWRKRMAATGKPVGDEELQMGLQLSPVRLGDSHEVSRDRGFHLSAVAEEEEGVEEMEDVQPSSSPSVAEPVDLLPGEESELDLQDPTDVAKKGISATEPFELDSSSDSLPLPEPRNIGPLRNAPSAANRGSTSTKQLRSAPKTTETRRTKRLVKETRGRAQRTMGVDTSPRPASKHERPHSPIRTSLDDALLPKPEGNDMATYEDQKTLEEYDGEENEPPLDYESDTEEQAGEPPQKTPRRGPASSKLPIPRNADESTQQQSPLTMTAIAAKLEASEREADAARVRAKLRTFRGAQRPESIPQPEKQEAAPSAAIPQQEEQEPSEDVDPVKRDPAEQAKTAHKPEKRKRDRQMGKTTRRRSTLSPWELDSLISGNVQQ